MCVCVGGGGTCGLLGKSLSGVSGSPGASKRNVDADRNHRNAWIRQTKGRNEWNGAREAGGDGESRITQPGHRRFSQIMTETERIHQRTPPIPPSKFLPCRQKTACIINRPGSERLRSAFSAASTRCGVSELLVSVVTEHTVAALSWLFFLPLDC